MSAILPAEVVRKLRHRERDIEGRCVGALERVHRHLDIDLGGDQVEQAGAGIDASAMLIAKLVVRRWLNLRDIDISELRTQLGAAPPQFKPVSTRDLMQGRT
jgi:hypothetical protein